MFISWMFPYLHTSSLNRINVFCFFKPEFKGNVYLMNVSILSLSLNRHMDGDRGRGDRGERDKGDRGDSSHQMTVSNEHIGSIIGMKIFDRQANRLIENGLFR